MQHLSKWLNEIFCYLISIQIKQLFRTLIAVLITFSETRLRVLNVSFKLLFSSFFIAYRLHGDVQTDAQVPGVARPGRLQQVLVAATGDAVRGGRPGRPVRRHQPRLRLRPARTGHHLRLQHVRQFAYNYLPQMCLYLVHLHIF